MNRLAGKTAVITGGSGGIGQAAAQLFANEGANVLIVDLKQTDLDRATAEIGHERVSGFVGDVTSADDNAAMIAAAIERYGGVDILLANAGIEGAIVPIPDYPDEMYDQVMAVNVKGVWLGIKAVIPAMRASGGGSIVITSSVAGLRGTGILSAYSTSKHAVVGLSRSAAKDLAPHGIRVNTVHPSPVETRMMRSLEKATSDSPQDAHDRFAAAIPLQRYADPEDIADLMLFLASDDAKFITGACHAIDGGSTA